MRSLVQVSWLAVWFACFAAPSARAQSAVEQLALVWETPAECAPVAAIRSELGRITQLTPERVVPPLKARVHIEKRAGRYQLTLHTEQAGAVGERTLSAADCRTLEREVTLVLAMALGEGVAAPQPRPEVSATPAKPAAPETVVAPLITPEDSVVIRDTRHRSAFHAAAFLGGGADFLTLTAASVLAIAGLELGLANYWLEPRFSWLPYASARLAQGIDTEYASWAGALAACAGWPLAGSRYGFCLGGELAAVRGKSRGDTSAAGAATAPLYAATAALSWSWPAQAVIALRIEARVRVALNEPHFVIEGLGDAYAMPRVLPSVAAAISFSPFR